MGQRGLLVSRLTSYSFAWPERWPGERDEPLLAQHLRNLVASSLCLFFSLEGWPFLHASAPDWWLAGPAGVHRVTQIGKTTMFTMLSPKLMLLFAHV